MKNLFLFLSIMDTFLRIQIFNGTRVQVSISVKSSLAARRHIHKMQFLIQMFCSPWTLKIREMIKLTYKPSEGPFPFSLANNLSTKCPKITWKFPHFWWIPITNWIFLSSWTIYHWLSLGCIKVNWLYFLLRITQFVFKNWYDMNL